MPYRKPMKKKSKVMLAAVCLAYGLCQLSVPMTAWGATKPISTVTIKVKSKLEPGMHLPDINIDGSSSDGEVLVSESDNKYDVIDAQWVDRSSRELKISDEPQMRVTLEPTDVGENYFPATYKSSSVKISGGSFVSARRDGDNLVVTLRVKGVQGEYGQPEDAYWNENRLGEARWEKPEDASGYYEVQLYREGKRVHKVNKTSSQQYNFYPYMTVKGEYTFRVRSIPATDSQKKYGEESQWTESGELSITDRYVSDGKGKDDQKQWSKPGASHQTGWFKETDVWRLRLPDGRICRSEWYMMNGLWYHFDENSVMQTGWIQDGGKWYHLWGDGQMTVGWARINDRWYYFYPLPEEGKVQGAMAEPGWRVIGGNYYYFNADGSMYKGWLLENGRWYYLNTLENSLEGAMFTGWLERDGKTYFLDPNGAMVQGWNQIAGSWYYFYPGSGEMARNTHVDGFYVDADGIWR